MIHIMGIVNLTPDSFYSGSRTALIDFLPKVQGMFADGADIVDIGACSTRPGAPQPSLEEEWARLEPALLEMSGMTLTGDSGRFAPSGPSHCPSVSGPLPLYLSGGGQAPVRVMPDISIDTYRPEIVRRAYGIIGPFIVNDVGGGSTEMLETVGRLGLPYIAMHGRKPKGDVIEDILDFFRDFAIKAEDAGIKEWILDPGFGFGKDIDENYEILNRLDELKAAGREILVGISRKSMIYKKLGITPEEAMPQTLALERVALEKGASWLRVHDVKETAQMVRDYSTM